MVQYLSSFQVNKLDYENKIKAYVLSICQSQSANIVF